MKTVLAMEHRRIPPTVHFQAPNPRIAFAGSPFHVAAGETVDWESSGSPRRAGVSSFGIGGTNAHVVLEEAPAAAPSGPSRPWQLLAVSGRSAHAAQAQAARLAEHLERYPDLPLADVAHTLREGRHAFAHRRIAVVREGEDAAAILRGALPERIAAGVADSGARSVVFLFPGLGDHHPNMARGLYASEHAFRAEVDRCAALLQPQLGIDIRGAIFTGDAPSDAAPSASVDLRAMLARSAPDADGARLNRTAIAQPAVFVVGYALARLWMSWGIVPDAVIGHSLGEYAAACIAGILSLEDALTLVAERAKAIEALPGGAMLAVSLDPDALRPYLRDGAWIATVNAPGLCVAAGSDDAVGALERQLADAGVTARRLPTTHAFHTPMLAAAGEALSDAVARVRLRPPRIPMVSNVSGTWIADAEATDPAYWTRHMLGTVRFAEGVGELLREPGRVLLEVGPGQSLSTFVRQRGGNGETAPVAVIPSMRAAFDRRPDQAVLVEALGRLWLAGVKPDWKAFRGAERRRKLHLPAYPWEKQRYWVEAPSAKASAEARAPSADPAEWTYLPDWRRSPAPPPSPKIARVLVLSEDDAGDALAAALRRSGRMVATRRIPAGAARDEVRALVDTEGGDADAVACLTNDPVTLLMLGAALAHVAPSARLVAVTRDAQDVTGREALDVTAAAVAAACLVLAQELAPLRARSVDVEGGAPELARLAAEIVAEVEDAAVALRGPHRWVRGYRAARASAPDATIREGGAYVLVGGSEGQNAVFARALAEIPGARIALVRPPSSALPPHSAEAGDDAAGALSLVAGLDDAEALSAALRDVEASFGRIDGVMWTPGDAALSLAAADEAKPGWRDELARAARWMEALETATGDRELDFCLLDSSLAGVLGGVGLVRAALLHAQADAFALRHARTSAARWT
ncbi:MAG: acyltransferase domain-containing protein, partial [Gemmatimonadetes bacterium]|nr:acyltransferase domain-containing protein [Gemmatimonadota bacterium]